MKPGSELIQLLNATFTEISSNTNVEVIRSGEINALSVTQIKSIIEELQQKGFENLTTELEDYFILPMQTVIEWEYKLRDEYEMGGRLLLHNPAIAVIDDEYKIIPYKLNAIKPDANLEFLKYFDKDLINGENFGAVINITSTHSVLKLGVYMDGQFYKLNLNLSEYIKYACLTKSFLYWQFLFCEDVGEDLRKDMRENYFKRMINDLPVLFPDKDYQELRKRVDAF